MNTTGRKINNFKNYNNDDKYFRQLLKFVIDRNNKNCAKNIGGNNPVLDIMIRKNRLALYKYGTKLLDICFPPGKYDKNKPLTVKIENWDSAIYIKKPSYQPKKEWTEDDWLEYKFDKVKVGKDANKNTFRQECVLNATTIHTIEKFIKYATPYVARYSLKQVEEKVIQAHLCQTINSMPNSDYFALDIEYNMEGVSDFIKDINGKKVTGSSRNTMTPGRADLLVITKPKNNIIENLYFVEVKYKDASYGGCDNDSKRKNKRINKYGSGIVGHMMNYVPLINLFNGVNGKDTKTYKQGVVKPYDEITRDVKSILNIYEQVGLIPEGWEFDSEKIKINKAKLAFFLAGTNDGGKLFKQYLGIENPPKDYNVKKLLDNVNSAYFPLEYLKLTDVEDLATFTFSADTGLIDSNNIKYNKKTIDFKNYKSISWTLFR
jgi:hypothetical protein